MIRVVIERAIAEGLEEPYEQAIRRTIQQAVQAPGFISGESLRDIDKPNHRVVFSTWQSVAHWNAWESSESRREQLNELSVMLETDEKVTILEPA